MTSRTGIILAMTVLTLAACLPAVAAAQTTIRVNPDTFSSLRSRLATEVGISEIILEAGVYRGSLPVKGPEGVDLSQHPLLIRADDGAEVILDGSVPIESAKPHEKHPGVYAIPYAHPGKGSPKLWEPARRVRYRLVADAASVAAFPASYALEDDHLLFHTSDGMPPVAGQMLMNHAYIDYGLFISRSHVTVRGITFRNQLLRDKWATAIQLRGDHITVEDCTAINTSIGFSSHGSHNTIRRCRVEDAGCAIYVGGENTTVEDCRLFKRRDGFIVPMYHQDDAGIQFYYPAKGGIIRGNLCVGFRTGIFIKAHSAPYLIEHNTIDGQGQGLGFGATKWGKGQQFTGNIIFDCSRELDHLPALDEGEVREIDFNCYWSPSREDVRPIGAHDLVADPKFAWRARADYRLSNDSPAVALARESVPPGAFDLIGTASVDLGDPREWHVSTSGRDGLAGTTDQPVKTIQFAVDRAGPGDTIVVHPGVFPDPVIITRGGTAERPLIIRASERWRAILDSNREAAVMVHIVNASHVQLHDLEIRWYGSQAVRIEQSPHITVKGCRIWNAHWGGWPTGRAVVAEQSPGFVGHNNLLFCQEYGFYLVHSPNFTITHNTCVANLYGALASFQSLANSVCRNNNFTFQGNDVIRIKDAFSNLQTFDLDHNNYGTVMRQPPGGVPFDSVTPREQDAGIYGDSKAIVNFTEGRGEMNRIFTMEQWRAFSGRDQHTLFADPLFVNAAKRDFRLEPNSPNIGAGTGSVTIGFHQP